MSIRILPCWARRPSAIIALVCAVSAVQAQNVPTLDAVFPQAGQNAISITSSIVVRAPAEIDVRSLTVRAPDAEESGWRPTEPTVLLVRESYATVTERALWSQRAIHGRMSFDDQRTIRWTPNGLLPGTKYRCVVSGVILDQRRGGAMCSPLEFSFTTAADVPHVTSTTLDSHAVIACSQPIRVHLSEPLPIPGLAQNIFIAEQLGVDGRWRRVETNVMLEYSRTVAVLFPRNNWPPGATLRVRCALSVLTGDTYDDHTYTTTIRAASRVRVDAVSIDGRQVPPDIARAILRYDTVLHHDNSFIATITDELPDQWRFVRWESQDLPQFDRSTSTRLDETIPCELYRRELVLRAILERVDSLTVRIDLDSGGTVDLFDQEGTQLANVQTTSWVRIPASVKKLICVATPAANTSFSSWGSTIPGINSSSAATIAIPAVNLLAAMSGHGVNGAPVAHTPNLVPKFVPLQGARAERYRLVARIGDTEPDPLFEVGQGVSFTTRNEFEDVVQETRTVCVQATRCWEIVGYHDPAVGPPVWFERGRDNLCLSSLLRDPENNVVIFARRKQLDLRLERVLLGSEDPNNILVGKSPHSESRVDVERRKRINGTDVWVPTSQVTCEQAGQVYARYAFHCGDNVRFVVRAASKRSEEWRWWSAKARYAIPAVESITEKSASYTMVIDLDVAQFDGSDCLGHLTGTREVRMQAAFRQNFGIASVGLRVRGNARGDRASARFEERWYDPATYYDVDPDEPRDGRQMEYIPRKGASVKVKFTMPIDGPSVLAGGMKAESSDNVLVTDPHAVGLDFNVTTGSTGNTNLLPANGQSADIVEFFICDPPSRPIKQALHGGVIDLTCTTALMSASGDRLKSDHLFVLRRMELPGFGLRLREADIAFDGDWDFWPFENSGEMYHAMYGADLATNAALLTTQGFKRIPDCGQQQGSQGECTDEHSDKDGPLSFGDKVAWLQTAWMGESDLAWWSMSTWDEDCKDENDCLVNRLGEVVDKLKKRADQYGSGQSEKDLDWKSILPDLVKTGADIIGALLPPDEQDDHLGEASILEDHQSLWGMRTAIAPRIEARNENITYRLRGQWFVSRSVVR
ncbi:MAG: hypothetical protein NTX15_08660 [Candidatus Kapabacteria bacterium]|nr:hypothetical protein [Candidatus Kapabacteria bacterium]